MNQHAVSKAPVSILLVLLPNQLIHPRLPSPSFYEDNLQENGKLASRAQARHPPLTRSQRPFRTSPRISRLPQSLSLRSKENLHSKYPWRTKRANSGDMDRMPQCHSVGTNRLGPGCDRPGSEACSEVFVQTSSSSRQKAQSYPTDRKSLHCFTDDHSSISLENGRPM